MKLQTKIVIVLVPPVVLAIMGLGFVSMKYATQGIHSSALRYIEGVLQTYITQDLTKRYDLLKSNRLGTVPSFVTLYQAEAEASAANISLLWPGHIFVFDREGRLVFDQGTLKVKDPEALWTRITEMNDNERSAQSGHLEGELYYSEKFESWGWQVFVGVSDKEVHATVNKIRTAMILLSIVSAAVIVFVLTLAFRHFFVKPIQIIRAAASDIAELKHTETISINSPNELMALARDLEKMSYEIFTAHQELLALNEALEQRVADRTLSLNKANEELTKEIKERRRTEEALRESEARFRAIFESTNDGIVVWDRNYRNLFINQAAINHLQTSREKTIGQKISDYPWPTNDLADLWMSRVDKAFEMEEHYRFEDAIPLKDYTLFIESIIFPIKTPTGLTFAAGTVYRDITERKQMEQALADHAAELEATVLQLEQKNKELDEFTYVASHDLQEPLRKLTSFSKLLSKDLGDNLPERAEIDIKYIVDAAERMRNLINDLLILSRAGRPGMKMGRHSLKACVAEATKVFSLNMEENNVEIIQDELPDIWGDPTLITQLYQNLISNALKFNDKEKKVVTITCQLENGVEIFGVKDNGIGMKPEYIKQIFTPFKRLHNRFEYEGTGVGLSICRKIVERHNGRIWAESVPSLGAHFKFTLGKRMESNVPKEN